MPIYAIGDLQGCLEPLERLVDSLPLDPSRDRLWFVGDLANRGPDSLGCLRYVKSLGSLAVTVLGNHDFHTLCVAEGIQKARPRDTLQDVVAAQDRDDLVDWLRHRPLMHVEGPYAMVHAGLLPEWSIAKARELAGEVEAALQGPGWRKFLQRLYGNEPARWDDSLTGHDRLRVIVNAMTRMRVCTRDGVMDLSYHGEPGETHGGRTPWFDLPARAHATHQVVCGHWSVVGLKLRPTVLSLDSGCVWGRALTAIRLQDRQVFQVRCPESAGQED
jgi:bis(5'-nucleosyl)-tetraphosphatase (symmetrical)